MLRGWLFQGNTYNWGCYSKAIPIIAVVIPRQGMYYHTKVCMPCMHAWYACLVCMPGIYARHTIILLI